MADFMTAVKTVGKKKDEKADSFLTAVSTQPFRGQDSPSEAQDVNKKPAELAKKSTPTSVNSPEDALQYLRSEPDADGLVRVLHQLLDHRLSSDFDLRAPGPLQAQIINAIVGSILPTFWSVLDKRDRALLVSSLRSVAGANAIAARLKLLADSVEKAKSANDDSQGLEEMLSFTNETFAGDEFALAIWAGLSKTVANDVKRQMAWKDFITLVASGKLVGAVARAEDALKASDRKVKQTSWLSSGPKSSSWLGRNIATILASSKADSNTVTDENAAAAQLLSKTFSLGYPALLIKDFIMALIRQSHGNDNAVSSIQSLLNALPSYSKRTLLENTLRWLSTLSETDAANELQHSSLGPQVRSSAAVINVFVKSDTTLQQQLQQFIGDPVLSATINYLTRRASVVALAKAAPDELEALLERLLKAFGEQLFIDHAPIRQQEAVAQGLLLTAGYLHRKTPMALLMTARSSGHMSGVSNRLKSSNQRARWLGMIVGTALSSLIDKEGSQMNFGTDDMQTEEAKWYRDLVAVSDGIGTLSDLEKLVDQRTLTSRKQAHTPKPVELPIINGKQTFGPSRPPEKAQTEVIGDQITEIENDEEDEDDDLKPYAKPDSDPEDSDEDATLVNRNKPRPPVYIRDLMRMLKENENHDRFQMAITHAPALIRRKANFGSEVKDHAEELALMLCDLQDPFDTEDFNELKLQALIAVLLSDVQTMGPWLSRQAFAGEYSLSQRCIMLSAIGLGGRELAGFKNQDELNPALPESTTSFPSKRLPGRLHAIYSPTDTSVKRLEAASKDIEHQLIKPMALSAADKTTSHLDAVKVRTFSSRMEVERTKRKPAPNQLAKVFGDAFFFPLVSRYQQEIAAYGPGSVFSSAPFVLVTFLKTLALLLHASGPATTHLAEITTAFWDLLLSLRVQAVSDISVLEAVLFSLLTLLEINTDSKQRLAQETPKQLMETQQWVEVVFERTGGGELVTEGSDEETRVRTMAAGVLVKTKEVIEAYQKLLMGNTYG